MELNLWMIKEAIKTDHIKITCNSHKRTIRTIRMFSDGTSCPDPGSLYIGISSDIFRDGSNDVICMHESGHLRILGEDLISTTNQILEVFDFYNDWTSRMYQAISGNRSLSTLLNIFEDTFGSMLMAMDSTQYLMAYSRGIMQNNLVSGGMVEKDNRRNFPDDTLLEFNGIYGDTFNNRGVFFLPSDYFPTESYVHHVFLENNRIATIIMPLVEGTWSQASIGQLEMMIPFITQWFQKNTEEESSYLLTSDLARVLDGSDEALPDLTRRLSLFGWQRGDRLCLYAGRSLSEYVNHNARLSHSLTAENSGIYAIPYQNNLVILCNHEKTEAESFRKRLSTLLHTNHYYASCSMLFTSLEQLRDAYRQARHVLTTITLKAGDIIPIQNCMIPYLADVIREHSGIPLLHPLILQIREYDETHRTEYYPTLFSYLHNERSHQITANELYIHRNTLSLRLSKIHELWQPDLEDANERLYLLLSFYLAKDQPSKDEGS